MFVWCGHDYRPWCDDDTVIEDGVKMDTVHSHNPQVGLTVLFGVVPVWQGMVGW